MRMASGPGRRRAIGAGLAAWVAAVASAGVGCRVELGAPRPVGAEGAAGGAPAGELWVCTSLYQHVVDDLERVARAALPEVKLQWFTGGSEKVSQRIDAELAAGGTRCDVLLVSDPFFFHRLAREGHLHPYVAPRALRADRSLVDLDGRWVTTRQAAMVIAYDPRQVDAARAPRSFAALGDPVWRGKLIMGDPLASGTFFTTIAFLAERYGDAYFERLRANEIVATGGNSAVVERVAAGEFVAGPVLLENVLAARRKGASLDFVVPEDGAVVIPGPVAIFAASPHRAAAEAFVDLLFTEAGQAVMVRGDMYPADPALAGPTGAPPWAELAAGAMPWSPEFIARTEARAVELRAGFRKVVQR